MGKLDLLDLSLRQSIQDNMPDMDAGDDGGEAVQGISFPASEIVLRFLVKALDQARKDGISPVVRDGGEDGSFCQLQPQVALQEKRTDTVGPFRDTARITSAAGSARLSGSGFTSI